VVLLMRVGCHPGTIFSVRPTSEECEEMRFHKPKGAIAIAIVSVGLSVLPRAVAASATSGKGSNPNSPFCKLEKASFAVNGPSSPKEKAVAKALEAGIGRLPKRTCLRLKIRRASWSRNSPRLFPRLQPK
jgi:hypothetical protein